MLAYIESDIGYRGVDPVLEWAYDLLLEIETYLAKWAAFERYCNG